MNKQQHKRQAQKSEDRRYQDYLMVLIHKLSGANQTFILTQGDFEKFNADASRTPLALAVVPVGEAVEFTVADADCLIRLVEINEAKKSGRIQ